MNREQAKQLLPFIKAFSEGEDVDWSDDSGKWIHLTSPRFNGAPERYRLEPETKYVPLSHLINSIDCEFGDAALHFVVGRLEGIKGTQHKARYCTESGAMYSIARPRMDHVHFWDGDGVPLTKGFIVEGHLRDGTTTMHCPVENLNWEHGGHSGDIIGFEVIGLQKGYKYPWDTSDD